MRRGTPGRRWLASVVPLVLLSTMVAVARGEAVAAAGATVSVSGLRTEYARNPLGIDVTRPRLSWVLTSARRGQMQTGYQILVASDPARLARGQGDVWNSGKVASGQSVNVTYAGRPLASRTRYHWAVRVWGRDNVPSAWSAGSWWETALLQQSEWQGSWIGLPAPAPLDLTGSQWIWYPEGDPGTAAPAGTRYFRRLIAIPDGKAIRSARLLLTVDDQFVAYLNGAEVARSTGTWQQAVSARLTGLRPGGNALSIVATNANTSPAGAIAVVEVTFTDGTSSTVRTDGQWKTTTAEAAGWTDPAFDDSAWSNARSLAPYGEGVWTCCGGVSLPPAAGDPLLRKAFGVTKPVRRARAYVSGLGYHELRLNGRKVGDSVLIGDVNDYTKRVGYSTYDVTSYLKAGGNAVGVLLGRGFYDVHQSTPLGWHDAPWRDQPKLLVRLEVGYADGTTATVVSDQSWQAAEGPITYDSVYGGEDHDARLEQTGWDTASFDAAGWAPARLVDAPGGRLVATNNDPVRVVDTLHSVRTTQPKPGTYVLDLGNTITGWGRLNVAGAAGTTVTLQYGQKLLADGTVDYRNSWHGGRSQTDRYTLKGGGTETWEPRFTFKSFRYLQVTGLPGAPRADTVVGRPIRSTMPDSGRFRSSNQLFNTFNDGMRRTILGNLVGYPAVDPFYEKSGWTEDVFVAARSIMYNFDTARLFTEWLADIRDSQLPSGQIPIIIPSPGWGYTSWGTPSPIWTAVYPIMVWRMYEAYGDRRLVEEHYPAVSRYLDRELQNLADGLVTKEFLGDWVAPGYSVPPEDTRLAATAYIYRQLQITADLAGVLGLAADAARYRGSAAFVRDRFNAAFRNEDSGRYETASDPGYRQTSNLLPLAFGMVPPEHTSTVLDGLVADVRARGNHLNTGAVGTEVILSVLTDNGQPELAEAIANQTTYPSWGYWYANGADTMWESWDLGTRSRSHFFLGIVDEWLYRHLAGIEAGAPGYKQIVIRPHPESGPATTEATFRSGYGEVRSAWWRQGKAFTLKVTVPVNTTALVYVPTASPTVPTDGARFQRLENGYAVFEVGSGNYQFRSVLP